MGYYAFPVMIGVELPPYFYMTVDRGSLISGGGGNTTPFMSIVSKADIYAGKE